MREDVLITPGEMSKQQQVAHNELDANFLVPSHDECLGEMAYGTCVDSMFLQAFAKMTEKDILIISDNDFGKVLDFLRI